MLFYSTVIIISQFPSLVNMYKKTLASASVFAYYSIVTFLTTMLFALTPFSSGRVKSA